MGGFLIPFVQEFRHHRKSSQDIIGKYLAERNLEMMATISFQHQNILKS